MKITNMFKIIKTSTYKELLEYKDIAIIQDKKIVEFTGTMTSALKRITELETQLHNLTAKKLPIKKTKNK